MEDLTAEFAELLVLAEVHQAVYLTYTPCLALNHLEYTKRFVFLIQDYLNDECEEDSILCRCQRCFCGFEG